MPHLSLISILTLLSFNLTFCQDIEREEFTILRSPNLNPGDTVYKTNKVYTKIAGQYLLSEERAIQTLANGNKQVNYLSQIRYNSGGQMVASSQVRADSNGNLTDTLSSSQATYYPNGKIQKSESFYLISKSPLDKQITTSAYVWLDKDTLSITTQVNSNNNNSADSVIQVYGNNQKVILEKRYAEFFKPDSFVLLDSIVHLYGQNDTIHKYWSSFPGGSHTTASPFHFQINFKTTLKDSIVFGLVDTNLVYKSSNANVSYYNNNQQLTEEYRYELLTQPRLTSECFMFYNPTNDLQDSIIVSEYDTLGNIDSSYVILSKFVPLSIHELTSSELRLFPNPAHNYLMLDYPISSRFQIAKLNGQVIIQGHLEKGLNKIDLSELGTGGFIILTAEKNSELFFKK